MLKHLINKSTAVAVTAVTLLLIANLAQAHFVWLAPETTNDVTTVQVYFGEEAAPEDPEYLKYTTGMQAWAVTQSESKPLDLTRTEEQVFAKLDGRLSETIIAATHDLGVMDRDGKTFRLKYYAKTGPALDSPVWSDVAASQQLRLNVIPHQFAAGVTFHVLFDGKAVAGSEVTVSGPAGFSFKGVTGEAGTLNMPLEKTGLFSIRAKFVEEQVGELEGKMYPETRHYSTLTLPVASLPALSDLSQAAEGVLQPLGQPVTSFGGAVLGDKLYIYGGQTGDAHSYSKEEQGNRLLQLDLKTGTWSQLAEGPGLQGLALVSNGKMLYRLGGFSAMNAEGEEHDLRSQNNVASFNVETQQWTELPALPERRSSHDAAVLDNSIYIVGGWAMQGEGDTHWHTTAWKMDLNQQPLHWQPLAAPPFQRRALAAAAHDGKLYVLGGMQHKGGPTTQVDVYDPAKNTWSQGPALLVKEKAADAGSGSDTDQMAAGNMTGFGASAFATGGSLYVTTVQGTLQRLSQDGQSWKLVSETVSPRFFHRLLPINEKQLIVVGGANMSTGKFAEVEVINTTDVE